MFFQKSTFFFASKVGLRPRPNDIGNIPFRYMDTLGRVGLALFLDSD
jgi:hypothetical protein